VTLAALIIGPLQYPRPHRGDWRATAAYLQERLKDSDCVLVYPAFNFTPLRYYLRREFCAILPTSLPEIDDQKIDAARIFAVLYHPKDAEIDSFRATMSGYGRELERFDAFLITIIEYQRVEAQIRSGM
jgi:hypothetical protein